MRNRCYLKSTDNYKYYGGRGITVCDEWNNRFLAYYDFVRKLENYGKEGYSLDRVDNDGDYYPDNVKYSTNQEQQLNRRVFGESRYRGVYFHKAAKKWSATICRDGKQTYLGLFNSELDAAFAYKIAAYNYREL